MHRARRRVCRENALQQDELPSRVVGDAPTALDQRPNPEPPLNKRPSPGTVYFLVPGVCRSARTPRPASKMATTRETIQRYFDALARKDGWESTLADDMVFTSFTSPPRQITGKEA